MSEAQENSSVSRIRSENKLSNPSMSAPGQSRGVSPNANTPSPKQSNGFAQKSTMLMTQKYKEVEAFKMELKRQKLLKKQAELQLRLQIERDQKEQEMEIIRIAREEERKLEQRK